MRSPEELRTLLTGPVMSVHTPFSRAGEIDFNSLRRLVDRGIAAGSTTVLLTYVSIPTLSSRFDGQRPGRHGRRPSYHSATDEQMEKLAQLFCDLQLKYTLHL